MNITSIGPNVALVPDARVDDGAIDVVMIGAADRDVLLDHLQPPDHEWWRGLGLRTVRAREVKAVVAAAEPLVIDAAATSIRTESHTTCPRSA